MKPTISAFDRARYGNMFKSEAILPKTEQFFFFSLKNTKGSLFTIHVPIIPLFGQTTYFNFSDRPCSCDAEIQFSQTSMLNKTCSYSIEDNATEYQLHLIN